ncbi:MAG: nuclear transport factor 2 family protein [Gemmatimonadaceae bacterium]
MYRPFHALAVCATLLLSRAGQAQSDRAGVDMFNRAFEDATRRMDTEASIALWDETGISLLPSTKPLIGKAAIAEFIRGVVNGLQGARMQSFAFACHDVVISGDWATEWCTEHQVVQLPAGQPPFDGWGKMLLVLRRGPDGTWRLAREMWNQAVPATGSGGDDRDADSPHVGQYW